MKKILMIGTGGTIASRRTDSGLAPGLTAADLLSFVPDVAEICTVEAMQLFHIDSTNVTPGHWTALAHCVREKYDAYDGFVICHGTDTLAYTAAALSYLIQRSRKPIVVTGAQKPIDVYNTDARTNLFDSFLYAADNGSSDVSIVFDGKVIVGTRAKKERAKSYNAFSSINFPYLAVIRDRRVIRYLPPEQMPEYPDFYTALGGRPFVLKLIPGIPPEILPWAFAHCDCIVIESFGVGGIPSVLLEPFYGEMQKPENERKIVVMTTQVVSEGSNMIIYEVGKKVKQDFGLIEAYDMTLEAVVTKLQWLLPLHPLSVKNLFYQTINHDILFK